MKLFSAILLLMVGTVVGQAYLKGSYTFPEKCKVPSRIALANGIVLATCVGEKWSADYHEGFTVDSDENAQPSWPYIKKAEPKVDVPAIQEKKCEDKLEPLTKEQVATVEQKQVMLASKETCGDFPCDTGDWTTYQCPKGFAFLDQWSGIIWSSIPDGEATIVDHWNKGPDAKKLEMCQNLAQFKTLKRTTKRVCYSTGKISCADSKRVLLTSVDGSIHVCHKVNQ